MKELTMDCDKSQCQTQLHKPNELDRSLDQTLQHGSISYRSIDK